MCNNHTQGDNTRRYTGFYPDLTGLFGFENNQDTHQQPETEGGAPQQPTDMSGLIGHLIGETERYLRQRYPDHQSYNNDNSYSEPSAPPQQPEDRQQQHYHQPQDQQQQHYQQQSQGQQQQQYQRQSQYQQGHHGRCRQEFPQLVTMLKNKIHDMTRIFGKTIVDISCMVVFFWILMILPKFIFTGITLMFLSTIVGLDIFTMMAGYFLVTVTNSCPTFFLALIGMWAFHRRFILKKPINISRFKFNGRCRVN